MMVPVDVVDHEGWFISMSDGWFDELTLIFTGR